MIIAWYVLLCYIFALPFFLIGIGEYFLAISFYVNAFLFAYMSRMSLVRNTGGTAFATVSIFLILFFYVAPIYQLIEYRGYLINNYIPSIGQMISANLFILAFTSVFLFVYIKRIGIAHRPLIKIDDRRIDSVFPVFAIISAVFALWAIQTVMTSSEVLDEVLETGTDVFGAIKQKVAFVIPFMTLGFYLCRRVRGRSLILVGSLLIFVLATKNIFLDRRNALGPIYLSMLFLLFWQGRIGSRSVFVLVGSALLFVFPITAIFINNKSDTWADVVNVQNIVEEVRGHFVDMHYDAWANLVASMQFVHTEGLQLGHQLLGTLLFFVPRSIWPDKAVSSAQMLGEYLVQNSGLWFTNISCPLPAEGYLDFGVLGVVLFAAGLAFYAQRMDFFIDSGGAVDKTSALYFAFYLTFVMRGSLLPAFAYGSAAYVAMNVVPALLSRMSFRPGASQTSPAAPTAVGV